MDLRKAMGIAEILENASPTSLAALASCASLKRVEKGAHLFRDKDDVDTIYTVISGMVSLYKYNSVGEKKVIFVFDKGKTINEVIINDLPASINCEVFQDACILCIPKDQLLYIMEQDFKLAKAVMDSMSMKIRRLYRQLKNTSNAVRGDKRIAAKLWKLSMDYGEKSDEGWLITMNLTITYLADMLGSKRETVSRSLKQLTDLGLVIYRDSHFLIPDRDRLAEYFKAP
ncbi:MAG TPA: Crp/Fnr family transcriptional regulator [Lachnospiraceae bacterium]|nr:Crp/Fnr family transcriptional regulator [Lachnospiraceae bacterium]